MSPLTDLPARIVRRLGRTLTGGRSVRRVVRAALGLADPADTDGLPQEPMTVEFEAAPLKHTPSPSEPTREPASPPQAAPALPRHLGPLEVTPVPAETADVMRFHCSAPLIDAASASFTSAAAADRSPLGRELFRLNGVRMIFVTQGFVSVTKTSAVSWHSLSPAIQQVLLRQLSDRSSVA